MSFASRNRDLTDVDFEELEELFAKLTPEEIEQLNSEVDPDVSNFFLNLIGPRLEITNCQVGP
jgi:hypothetical protein